MLRTESGANQNWVAVERRGEAAIASDLPVTASAQLSLSFVRLNSKKSSYIVDL
jgi:hypothetical protein